MGASTSGRTREKTERGTLDTVIQSLDLQDENADDNAEVAQIDRILYRISFFFRRSFGSKLRVASEPRLLVPHNETFPSSTKYLDVIRQGSTRHSTASNPVPTSRTVDSLVSVYDKWWDPAKLEYHTAND
jgi:hypothetical protein